MTRIEQLGVYQADAVSGGKSMWEGQYLNAKRDYEAGNPLPALLEVAKAAESFLRALSTCHICECDLHVAETPAHCEDCSPDCDEHAGPECDIPHLFAALSAALAALEREGK